MGNISITEKLRTERAASHKDQDWEQASYQIGCATARQESLRRLHEIEEWLFQRYPKSWHVEGSRQRTLVTRFGEIAIKRRLYRDEEGAYHFLLDEYLRWMPGQLATPSLQESLVELCAQVPFRSAGQTVEKLTAGVLSTPTVYRMVEKTANRALKTEEKDWQGVFERGEIPLGEKQVPILFSEGDGTWIHLQQEEQANYEIKDGIAYEGWARLSGEEEQYALVNKRVYCQGSEKIPFWEGASLEWSRVWDLSTVREIVIGGDGANWIDQGIEEFPGAIRQLDGFHLARASGRGWQDGKSIYEAIRAGKVEEARSLIRKTILKQGQGATQSRRYVENNLEKGRDWRTHSEMEGRGLGTMEANQDKLVCNRMKKRGLSWTRKGALRMAKVLQLKANGEIRPHCVRQPLVERTVATKTKCGPVNTSGYQKWLEAGLPALVGPHANRPWVAKLRNLANLNHQLN